MGEWFDAEDFGECAGCGEEYAPGELIYEVKSVGLVGECCGRNGAFWNLHGTEDD